MTNDPNITMDCTDIQAILSGLVDDEIDTASRHRAERHLAACRPCRELLDRAETLDGLIEAHVAGLIDPDGLPDGFETAVLLRTAHAGPPPSYLRQWTTWAGWLAAAAALALAVTVWVMDRRAGLPHVTARTPAPAPMPVDYRTGTELRSLVYDGPTPETEPALRLSRDEAESLYFASVVLGMVAEADPGSFADIERVREAIAYEDLLPQLAEARRHLASDDLPPIFAAESVLLRIARGPLSEDDVEMLRATVVELGLAESIDAISDRRVSSYEL